MGDSDIIRRLNDEVFVGGNLAAFDELVADGYVTHDPPPGFEGTKAGFRQAAELIIGAMSDRKIERDDFVDTTDGRVAEDWEFTGTHTGELFGIPASNQRVRIRGTELHRCADGKIVENWGTIDISDIIEKATGG
jgi:steroid delta-isomerase-like uncharacterized protein